MENLTKLLLFYRNSNLFINNIKTEIIDETGDEYPLITVTMITYNHESYIGQAIEGVVNQVTSFKFVLLIGDDCSTDSTREIIKLYQKKYPSIIKLKLPERNLGINANSISNNVLCVGNYIALCEGDDYWTDPYKLQKQVDFLEANPEYSVCGHSYDKIDELGRKDLSFNLPLEYARDSSGTELIRGFHALTCTLMFRNIPAIQKLPNEFHKVTNADTFLLSILGQYGHFKFLPEIKPSAYRQHNGGVYSSKSREEKAIMQFTTFFWLYTYYKRINRVEDALYWFNMMMQTLDSVSINYSHGPAYLINEISRLKSELNALNNMKSYKLALFISRIYNVLLFRNVK